MKRHIQAKHTGTRDYKCPFCGNLFKTEEGRQKHVKKHGLQLYAKDIRALEESGEYPMMKSKD
jgi:uncharacterized C2H2 Zn-finger protein